MRGDAERPGWTKVQLRRREAVGILEQFRPGAGWYQAGVRVLQGLSGPVACYGECPRNSFIKTPDGEDGLNYLCAGYKAFFTHIDQPMKTMANLILEGRYADEIMQAPQAT